MRSLRNLTLNNAVDLLQLVHQVGLIMQAACSINEQNISLTRNSSLHGIKDNCCRVCTLSMTDNVTVSAFAPNLQLLAGCGAEGVACCQNNLILEQCKVVCQLADGRSFAYAVNADNEDNRRLSTNTCTLTAVLKQLGHILFEKGNNILGALDFLRLGSLAYCFNELFRCFYAYVRRQQNHLQLI